ncbi:GEVED domain-containing protein [Larkinella soli]|uniref:GEVED domain-containing protein n=1 Tax=Larkinella soli TaxID=1770527 RepID=UPI0013E2AE7E|nr:GEVED domain-containing protein [Larkinella soli]
METYRGQAAKLRAATTVRYVPLKVFICRKTDGTGGADIPKLLSAIASANARFQSARIQFFMTGPPTIIRSDACYDFDYDTEYRVFAGPMADPKAINVFVLNSLALNGRGIGGLYAGEIFLPTVGLNGQALTHELGHAFSLMHTFGAGTERVARTNCTSKADGLCDTPADPWDLPGGSGADDGTMVFKGTIRDPDGNLYQPMMNNVMSEWMLSRSPSARFTAGQLERMANYLTFGLQHPSQSLRERYSALPEGVVAPAITSVLKVNGKVQINWQDRSANETGFFIERAVAGSADFLCVGGVGPNVTTFTDTGVPLNTNYMYRIRPANTATGSLSPAVSFSVGNWYCLPQSANAVTSNPNARIGIDEVTIRTADNTTLMTSNNTGFAADPDFYSDFSSSRAPATLKAGQGYRLTIRALFRDQYSAVAAVWVDLNQDGTFGRDERLVVPAGELWPGNALAEWLFIPATAKPGKTYMRIRIVDPIPPDRPSDLDPCGILYGRGETEDYALTILAPTASGSPTTPTTSCTPPVAVISGDAVIQPGATAQLKLTVTASRPWNLTVVGTDGYRMPVSGSGSLVYLSVKPTQTATYFLAGADNVCGKGTVSGQARITVQTPCLLPTASLAESKTLFAGQTVQIRVNLTGSTPLSLTMSDGQVFSNKYFDSQYVDVHPTTTTTYTVKRVSNACGVGTTSGSALVTVRSDCPLPAASMEGNETIRAGSVAMLPIAVTAAPPWSVTVAGTDGYRFSFTHTHEYVYLSVKPAQTTVYTLLGVSNACGRGSVSGKVTITVQNTAARLAASAEAVGKPLRIYPNPAGSGLLIRYTGSGDWQEELFITDLSGRVLKAIPEPHNPARERCWCKPR